MTDLDTPIANASTRAPDRAGQIERPTICVFDAPADVGLLVDALSRIGFRTVVNPDVADPNYPGEGRAFAAVVITDGADEPLRLAAEMSAVCPVLYLASELFVETRLAAARAGVDAIVLKPIDSRELADWLNDHVGRYGDRQLAVLVIDDDEILAETYALALEKAGMRALVETDAATALNQIMTSQVDIILLDIQMPRVSGIDVARAIRQSRRFLSTPIVFLSFERDEALRFEARRIGGDDFVSKPVDLRHLVSVVRMRADRAVSLRKLMERDSLTGLLNHGRFIDRLHHEMERCRRTGAELSLAFVDIDHFKAVNDVHGHIHGDHVLRTLARVLTVGLRQIDTVGRYGGEEFAVLLLDTNPEAAGLAVDKIRRNFAQIEFHGKNATFSVTFSAGIAGTREHLTAEDLISAADENMYCAKRAGRNRIVARWSP